MSMTRRSVLASLITTPFWPGLATAGTKLNVVATTGMIGDSLRQMGGDAVNVTSLMGAGIDPHGYRATRSDIVAMSRADMVLWNGLFLEAQMMDVLDQLAARKPVIAVAEALAADVLLRHADYEGKPDPHVWMAPELWAEALTPVTEALVTAAPHAEDQIRGQSAAYLASVRAVGAYGTKVLSALPAESRVLITAHDAFGYFGANFGFEVMGIQGISTESEAGLQRIGELVDILVDRKIGAVFVETSVSDRNIRALIEGAAARGHDVTIGGELFSDAMGPEGTYQGTYVGMMDHNFTTIASALGADVPAGGMQGRLA